MRIAQVLSTPFPPEEGIGTYVRQLTRRLAAEGHHCTVLTRGGRRGTTITEVEDVKVVRARFVPLYPVHVQLHGRALRRALAKHGPFDLVHMHSPMPPAIDPGAPMVLTVHTAIGPNVRSMRRDEPLYWRSRAQLPFAERNEARLVAAADQVTTVSESGRATLLDRGIDPARVRTVPNGIDARRIAPVFEGRAGTDLLYVGRLAPRKGLSDLLQAVAVLARDRPGGRLSLVGQGPLEAHLRRLAARLGIADRVDFLGFVPNEHLLDLWSSCRLFVHLPEFEGMPTSVLEAMAYGIPVLTTDSPGTNELVADGVDGRLVPPRSPVAAAAAMHAMLTDPEGCMRMARQARRRVEEHHAWDRLFDQMLEVYDDALNGMPGLRGPGGRP